MAKEPMLISSSPEPSDAEDDRQPLANQPSTGGQKDGRDRDLTGRLSSIGLDQRPASSRHVPGEELALVAHGQPGEVKLQQAVFQADCPALPLAVPAGMCLRPGMPPYVAAGLPQGPPPGLSQVLQSSLPPGLRPAIPTTFPAPVNITLPRSILFAAFHPPSVDHSKLPPPLIPHSAIPALTISPPEIPSARPLASSCEKSNTALLEQLTSGNPSPNVAIHVEPPYKLIHSVLCTVQNILEEALFGFAKKWVPDVLRKMGWDEPVQGELNIWLQALERYSGDVIYAWKATNVKMTYMDFKNMMNRLHQLRHAAVHRLQVTMQGLRRFMLDALDVVKCLQDRTRYNKLRVIEFGVWKPQNVNLEVVMTKPLGDFVGAPNIPDRDTFVDPAIYSDLRSGLRPKPFPMNRDRVDLILRSSREGPIDQARSDTYRASGDQSRARKRRRLSRSRSLEPVAPSRILRSSSRLRLKRLRAEGVIDLTDDGEEEKAKESMKENAEGDNRKNPKSLSSRDVIDLTEED